MFFSNKAVLLIGATMEQFPSEREKSFGGKSGFKSASLYKRIMVPNGTQDHNGSCEKRTAPDATPLGPWYPLLSSKIHPLISIHGGVGLLQL